MTINQLIYFTTVVKTSSFSKAAKQLYVSQAAISFSIKELEKEFDTSLFIRYNNQIVLTDEGHHLYKIALNLIQNYNNAVEDMKGYLKKTSTLKIGVPPMLGSIIVPSLIQEYTQINPTTEIQLVELGSSANQKAIVNRELSCGFTVIYKDNIDESLDYIKLSTTSLYFAINKNNPLAKKESLSISDIKNIPLILMKEDSLQSALIQSEFAKNNLVPNIKIRTNQVYTIKELIKNSNIGAFVFTQTFKNDSDEIVLVPLKEPLNFDIVLAWGKGISLNKATKELIDYIKIKFDK
mgnify:CR=1 FL=1